MLKPISKFSKVTEFLKNQHTKSITFLYTDNNYEEKEIKKIIHFIIPSKIIYFGINLNKEIKDPSTENYKALMKETQKGINKWKDIPCSQTRRINIFKMSIPPKAISSFN